MQQYLTAAYIIPVLAFLVACYLFQRISTIVSNCKKALHPDEYTGELATRYAVKLKPLRNRIERLVAIRDAIRTRISDQVEAELGTVDRRHAIYAVAGSFICLAISLFLIQSELPLFEQDLAAFLHIESTVSPEESQSSATSNMYKKQVTETPKDNGEENTTNDILQKYALSLFIAMMMWGMFILDILGITHCVPWLTNCGIWRRLLLTGSCFYGCYLVITGVFPGMVAIQGAATYHTHYSYTEKTASTPETPDGRIDLEAAFSQPTTAPEQSNKPSLEEYLAVVDHIKKAVHLATAFAVAAAFSAFRWLYILYLTTCKLYPVTAWTARCVKREEKLSHALNNAGEVLKIEIVEGSFYLNKLGIKPGQATPLASLKETSTQTEQVSNQTSTEQKEENIQESSSDDNTSEDNNFNNQPGASGFNPFDAIKGGK